MIRRSLGAAGSVVFVVAVLAGSVRAGEETTISGFVDASYFGNVDTKEETFGLDQVEVDVERVFGENGTLHADLEWVKNGDDWTLAAEQGYLTYRPDGAERLAFTLGKFNAPIGFELLDAPDIYQYSHALVFIYALPTNLTGAMVNADLAEGFDLAAYLVNGWDNNQESNGVKTFGGRLGYMPGEVVAAGLSAIRGSEGADQQDMRTVVDLDLTVKPRKDLFFGGEFNYGKVEAGGNEATWTGCLAMAHYDITGRIGLTGRFDYLDDPDTYVFGGAAGETRTAFTIAPTFTLGDGMGALIEVRVDQSSEDVFIDGDGETDGSETTVAFEMTYTF
ncbi:MAG: outer membrane beta-barrel protein [Candidatus Eisenbacteria bacterium]|nr:outer membrane beta-barrel protein [Candidatus Eisenbacteria bacterium]